MSVIFRNESRRDLAEAIRTDYTCDYLFPKVFPAINVYEEAGKIAVATKLGVTGDTNRSYDTDLTVNHYGNTPVDFAVNSYEARVGVTDSDLKLKGDDLDIIQPELANAAAEAAVGDMEIAAAAALNTAAESSVTLTTTAPLAGIAEAAYKVAPYGQPTLICSQSFLTSLISQPAFSEPILKLFGEGVITGLIGGAEAVMQSVGGWMGLPGGILVGKDIYWKEAFDASSPEAYPGFVVGLRPEMRDPARAYWTAKAKPAFGATLTFLPRDTEGTPWFVDTVYLPGSKLNCVDVGIKAVPKVFNKEAAVAISFGD